MKRFVLKGKLSVLRTGLTTLFGLAVLLYAFAPGAGDDRARSWEIGGIYWGNDRVCTASYSSERELVVTATHCIESEDGSGEDSKLPPLRFIAQDGSPVIDLPRDLARWRILGDIAQYGARPLTPIERITTKRVKGTHYALTYPVRIEGDVLYLSTAGLEGAWWMPDKAPVGVVRVISFPGMSGTLIFDRLHDRPVGVLVGGIRGTDVTIVALLASFDDRGSGGEPSGRATRPRDALYDPLPKPRTVAKQMEGDR